MREVQDRIEQAKQGYAIARTREGWTRDCWDEGCVDQISLGRGKCGPGLRTQGPSKTAEPRCWVVDQGVQGDQGLPGDFRTSENILLMKKLGVRTQPQGEQHRRNKLNSRN